MEIIIEQNDITYPRLMQTKDKYLIILMTNPSYGIVLVDTKQEYMVGHGSHSWDMTEFSEFKGQLIFKQ